jgi:hypothetical protein
LTPFTLLFDSQSIHSIHILQNLIYILSLMFNSFMIFVLEEEMVISQNYIQLIQKYPFSFISLVKINLIKKGYNLKNYRSVKLVDSFLMSVAAYLFYSLYSLLQQDYYLWPNIMIELFLKMDLTRIIDVDCY